MKLIITPDKQKAKALLTMARISLERLRETAKSKYPTNTLNDYYDIIHKLMEATTLKKGIKFKGDGAHKELIDFICKTLFNEQIRIFLQEMRDYRNRISYEGFQVNANYITLNEKMILKIINMLKK
jgi:hypothetical protein